MLERIKKLFNIKKEDCQISSKDKIENLFDKLNENIILVNVGEDLTPFGKDICSIVQNLREEIKDECGFIIPEVHIKENCCLQENEFNIYIREKLVKTHFVIPTKEYIYEDFYENMKTIIYEYLEDIFTNELTEKYINAVQKNNVFLIWNITNILSVVQIKTILSDIISYGKSISNINYIFEKIGEQILSESDYKDCLKKYNPHIISNNIIKNLK